MDSKSRFNNLVADYAIYRPRYPQAVVSYLQDRFGISKDKLIADIGSGTGISSVLFLDEGYNVTGVEPNEEMREMSLEMIRNNPLFRVVAGSAEQTGLETGSIDVVVCGQAFHWFDAAKAKEEFKRILKPDGYVVLIWNERLTYSAFEKAYEAFICKYATDYEEVDHRNVDMGKIKSFFAPDECTLRMFDNQQVFDFDGLKGRLLSSSYIPRKDDAGYESMLSELQELFDRFNDDDLVTIQYATKVYVGKLDVNQSNKQ